MGGRKEESLTLNGRTIKTQTLTSNGRSLKERTKIKEVNTHYPKEIIFMETKHRKKEKGKSMDGKTPNPKEKIINKIKRNKTVRVISRHNPRNIRNINLHASENE